MKVVFDACNINLRSAVLVSDHLDFKLRSNNYDKCTFYCKGVILNRSATLKASALEIQVRVRAA